MENQKRAAPPRARGNFAFIGRFKEAIGDAGAAGAGKRFRVTMLEEGLGNFGDSFYYTAPAIQSCPPVFEGKKFMLNHPSESEESDRPERDVRDISGYFENCAAEKDADGRTSLMGDLVVCGNPADPADPFKRERVLMLESIEYAKKHVGQALAALSINAGGDFDTMPIEQFLETGDIPDVCKEKLLEAVKQGVTVVRPVRVMQAAVSCDLVTTAGAGGSINQLLEGGTMKPAKKPGATTQDTDPTAAGAAKPGATTESTEDEGAAGGDAAAAGGDDDSGDDDNADAGADGEHDDAAQDEELIKSMLDKYVGDPQHSDEDKAAAKEAYQAAKESGLEGKEAEKAAGYAMKMAKQKQAKEAKAAMEAAKAAETESQEAGGLDNKAKPVGDAGSAAKDQKSKESGRGETVVKLTAEVARLSSELEAIRLEKHMDKALRESKLPMSATKKFRECVKGVKNVKDFDSKLGIFKEAFGLRSEAQDGGFILGAEKQGGEGGEVGLDFSDCTRGDE